MRNFLCFCILLLAFAACKPGIPKEVIPQEKMTDILYNISLADGYITTIPNQDSAKRLSAAYYKGIYKKFAVDSASYTKSMNYYYDHPEVLAAMYTEITGKLDKDKVVVAKQDEKRLLAEKKKTEEAAKKLHADSLKKGLIKIPAKVKEEAKQKKDSVVRAKTQLKRNPGLTQMVN